MPEPLYGRDDGHNREAELKSTAFPDRSLASWLRLWHPWRDLLPRVPLSYFVQPTLRLFGLPTIVRNDRSEPIRLKRCALLLALLAAEPQGIAREVLAERLWADGDEKSRRNRLRRLVFEARAQLGETALTEENGWLKLDPAWLTGCDLHLFLETHAVVVLQGATKHANFTPGVIAAAHLPLLGDLHFDEICSATEWLDYLRIAQTGMRRRMRERLVNDWLKAGQPEAALSLLLQELPSDPLDETGAELAATLMFHNERFAECIALFNTLRHKLSDELKIDVAPSFHRLAADAKARLATSNVWGSARPKTRYVASSGAHIAYQVFGVGARDLLLVPGFVSNVEMVWELPKLSRFFADLAKHFRVILFDRHGVGLSDRVAQTPPKDRAICDIVAVLDAVGSSSTIVFAASEGGPTSIRLATEHPDRVAGLCLFGTLAKGSAEGDYTCALSRQQYDYWLNEIVTTWGTPAALQTFCPSHADDPVLREWWSRMLRLSSSPASVALILEQLRDVDVRPLLGGLACPVTLIHRRGDRAVRIESARFMAERIPGARLVELNGIDHFWWMNDEEVVLAELQQLNPRPA